MKNKISLLIPFIYSLSLASASDPDRIWVTADRIPAPAAAQTGSVTRLDGEALASSGADAVEALQGVPGVSVLSGGGITQPPTIFVRGLGAEHVLFIQDGLRMNDPTSTTANFNFANLDLSGAGGLEVLRGPRSFLYGSSAMGGVILLNTAIGKEERVAGVGYGTFQTFQAWARAQGKGYAVGVSGSTTRGFSAASEQRGNVEPDGGDDGSVYARVRQRIGADWEVDGSVRAMRSVFSNDAFGGNGGDDPDADGEVSQLGSRVSARWTSGEAWEPSLSVSYLALSRKSRKGLNDVHPWALASEFAGSRFLADWQNGFFLTANSSTIAAFSFEREAARGREENSGVVHSFDQQSSYRFALVGEHEVRLGPWGLSGGVRWDRHDRFGGAASGRVLVSHQLAAETRLESSLGTGFKAPSLYQLYSRYGRASLRPERSEAIDLGFRQGWGERASLSATAFLLRAHDLIDYDFVAEKYWNAGRIETRGMESEASVALGDAWSTRLSYTYTLVRNLLTGERMLRRPLHQVLHELRWKGGIAEVAWTQRWLSSRPDVDPQSFARSMAPSVWVSGISMTLRPWRASPQVRLRIDNLLDRQYEEVMGFGAPGRSIWVAMEQRW